MRAEKKNLIAGLDIGTSKICAIIGKAKTDGLDILGSSIIPSEGVSKGVITSINKVSSRIKQLVKNAELDAGRRIDKLWVSIAGLHIEGKDNQSFISTKGEEHIITKKDLDEAFKKASSIALPQDRELIHALIQDYIIDGQDQIKNPLEMRGMHLQLKVHLISAASGCCRNIEESVKKAGFEVEGLVLQPLSSGISTLSPQEKELGVAMLDIGGGTTDLAIFIREGLRFTKVIAVGGNHLTNDIAVGLHVSHEQAEKIKLEYGSASTDYLDKDEYLQVQGIAGRGSYEVKRSMLVHIIQMRIEELFELVDLELKSSGYKGLITAGIVLTGGSSLLSGIKEKAEEKLGLPARIGYPKIDTGAKTFSPVYATAIGLIIWGMKNRQEASPKERLDIKLKEWLKNFF